MNRPVNEGFSGGEKKAQRDFPDGGARAEAGDPRRNRFRSRHRCAEDRLEGINRLRGPERAIILVTHYQRLLELRRSRLRPRAGRWPHRQVRRQGTRSRARREGLRVARGKRRAGQVGSVRAMRAVKEISEGLSVALCSSGKSSGAKRAALASRTAKRSDKPLRRTWISDGETRRMEIHERWSDRENVVSLSRVQSRRDVR